jgi:DNA-binding protein HU-beta
MEVRVNKADLVDHIANATGRSKKDVEEMLHHMMEGIKSAVSRGEKVALPGFGSFARTERKARTGRNPQTGEAIEIAASKGVKFTAGAGFKSAVN